MCHNPTVLIVDDEANVLKSLRRLFLETDYRVLTAESGQLGLEAFAGQTIDLVISDYRMPEMNGVEFFKRVCEISPDTVRMILSGFADISAIVEAVNDGQIYKFLAKPWNDQELLSTVRRALEHASLQRENRKLLSELQTTNAELTKLAAGLEDEVRRRTQDLEGKSRAVTIAHSILNLLAVGVIGIDSEDTIVYMNPQLGNYVDVSRVRLSAVASEALDEQLYEVMRDALSQRRPISRRLGPPGQASAVCTPLHNGAGVVAMIGYLDSERYACGAADQFASERKHE